MAETKWTKLRADEDVDAYLARHSALPVKGWLVAGLWETVIHLFKTMGEKNIERNARLDALEARLAAIEETAFLKYLGVWETGKSYQPGDATTFSGSLWVCKAAHTAIGPVADHAYWQLAVKRGKGAA